MNEGGFPFLSYLAAADGEPAGPVQQDTGTPPGRKPDRDDQFPPDLVHLAKRIKAIRDSRIALLDPSLFGEPAWNILLALYVAAGEGYALPISALCAESGVPATTATRAINRMLELDMVRRVANPSDNRSTYIELMPETAAKLTELLHIALRKHLADCHWTIGGSC